MRKPFLENEGLSSEQLRSYHENGYLIIPDALDSDTVQELLDETHRMLHEFPIENHPMTKFSTGQEGDVEHVGDDYFLTSGDKVRFFFEEDAFDKASGELIKPKHLAINKIGHALHVQSPAFRRISLSACNRSIASSLGFRTPLMLQSMVICKQPEIGGAVPPHQDSTFLYTDPPSAVGFWYALEDANISNGCLSFAKGSHRRSEIKQRFVRLPTGGTGFENVTGARFPRDETSIASNQNSDGKPVSTSESEQEDPEYTLGEVKAGSLVLIHGNVLHRSEKNTSPKSRYIYTFHLIEGDNEYDSRNWLQLPINGEAANQEDHGFARLFNER